MYRGYSILYIKEWHSHTTYTHVPVYFKSSLGYLSYLMKCKLYTHNYILYLLGGNDKKKRLQNVNDVFT